METAWTAAVPGFLLHPHSTAARVPSVGYVVCVTVGPRDLSRPFENNMAQNNRDGRALACGESYCNSCCATQLFPDLPELYVISAVITVAAAAVAVVAGRRYCVSVDRAVFGFLDDIVSPSGEDLLLVRGSPSSPHAAPRWPDI